MTINTLVSKDHWLHEHMVLQKNVSLRFLNLTLLRGIKPGSNQRTIPNQGPYTQY